MKLMNRKRMTLVFFELCTVYIRKTRAIPFPYLLANLFKQRYISSVKSYKYLNKFKVKHKNNGLNPCKNTCMCAQTI